MQVHEPERERSREMSEEKSSEERGGWATTRQEVARTAGSHVPTLSPGSHRTTQHRSEMHTWSDIMPLFMTIHIIMLHVIQTTGFPVVLWHYRASSKKDSQLIKSSGCSSKSLCESTGSPGLSSGCSSKSLCESTGSPGLAWKKGRKMIDWLHVRCSN